MAGEKEMACCVEAIATTYKDIWAAGIREVLVRTTEPTNVGIYSRKIFSYVFCTTKIKHFLAYVT